MKELSQWTSRHSRIAIFSLVLCEMANDFNGVLPGANGVGSVSSFYLYPGILLLIGLIFFPNFPFGFGGLTGTVYFLERAVQKPLKRRRDMTPDERRRDNRRFWLAWLLIIGIVLILLSLYQGQSTVYCADL